MLRSRLKEWLKRTKTSRAELAAQLMVSPKTVEGWLLKSNPRPIPLLKHAAIEALIAPKPEPGCIALPLSIPAKDWELLTQGLPPGIDKEKAVAEYLLGVIRAGHNVKNGL